jgi:hypothetical protein
MKLASREDFLNLVWVIIFPAWFLTILVFYLKKKNLPQKLIFSGIIFFFIITLIKAIFQTYLTYLSWKSHPIGKYLLPPYQKFYFFRYSFFHYFFGYILTIAGSLIILFFLFLFRKRLETGELTLGFFGGLVSGWPNLIIYFSLFLFFALIFSFFKKILRLPEKRTKLTLPLIFSTLLVLIFGNYFANYLKVLKI